MSNSCEILSPSRSSNIIQVEGSAPYNEGSNDSIVTRKEVKKNTEVLTARFFIGPAISESTKASSTVKQKIKNRFGVSSRRKRILARKSRNFSDRAQNNVLNKSLDNLSNTKEETRTSSIRNNLTNNFYSFGVNNTIESIDNNLKEKKVEFHVERPAIFKSPPDLNLLDKMYLENDVSVEYYSSPNKISKSGLIEPLYIRETSTFEFNEKSLSSTLSITDVRKRSFTIKETINYNSKNIEFFEDNVDSFHQLESSAIKNKFVETYNSVTKKHSVSTSIGKVHNNKILDTSWISTNKCQITSFEEINTNIKSEISSSEYMTLNNTDILKYYMDNDIKVSNSYPKIFEDKYSTGYTYDRSKVQGLDSISFGGFLE